MEARFIKSVHIIKNIYLSFVLDPFLFLQKFTQIYILNNKY